MQARAIKPTNSEDYNSGKLLKLKKKGTMGTMTESRQALVLLAGLVFLGRRQLGLKHCCEGTKSDGNPRWSKHANLEIRLLGKSL